MRGFIEALLVTALALCLVTCKPAVKDSPVIVRVVDAPIPPAITTPAKDAAIKDVVATGKAIAKDVLEQGAIARGKSAMDNLECWTIGELWTGGGGKERELAELTAVVKQSLITAEADIAAYQGQVKAREAEIAKLIASAGDMAETLKAANIEIETLFEQVEQLRVEVKTARVWREKLSWGGVGIFAIVSLAAAIFVGLRWPFMSKFAAAGWLLLNGSAALAVWFTFYRDIVITAAWIAGIALAGSLIVGGVLYAWQHRLNLSMVKAVDAGVDALSTAGKVAFREAAGDADVPSKAAKSKLVKALRKEIAE